MRHPKSVSLSTGGNAAPSQKSEIDYSPREYTFGEMLHYGWKFGAVAALVLVLFWLIEKYLY